MTASSRGRSKLAVRVESTTFVVEVEDGPAGGVVVRVDGQPVEVDARLPASGPGSLLLDGVSYLVDGGDGLGDTAVVVNGEVLRVQVEDLAARRPGGAGARGSAAGQRLAAPMPGKVVAVLVTLGQTVERGAGLVVLEAMKMENEFRATGPGVVKEILVAPGQAVNAGDLLVVVG
jgi:glutaconyl-CoA/methylmalonyl-CoA decarboxylase subunit gamma